MSKRMKDQEGCVEDVYMAPAQLTFFRQSLLARREELLGVSNVILTELKEGGERLPDLIDYSTLQAEKERVLLAKHRSQQLIGQIDRALYRIDQGEYGYCELTGEEIGIERLKVMPFATMSIKAQEDLERAGRRPGRRL